MELTWATLSNPSGVGPQDPLAADILALLPSWLLASLLFSLFVTAFAICASTQALLRWDAIHWPWSHVRCCGPRLPGLWDPASPAACELRLSDVQGREAGLQAKLLAILGGAAAAAADENEPWPAHAEKLRALTRGGYLSLDSVTSREGMLDFFAGHRVMARQKCLQCSLGIRMTVHYNLFCGTILALGSDKQRQWLREVHTTGALGCFLLTEVGAGVLSGLVVETVATWVWSQTNGADGIGYYDLHTPSPAAEKTWISQGLSADWGVVIAQLVVDGQHHGPHVFLLNMHAPGVCRKSMQQKTTFNALDNAQVSFNHVRLPGDALLSRLCQVEPSCQGDAERPKYTFVGDRPPSFLVIAQRLLSGRLCISDSAIAYLEDVLVATQDYADTRVVWVDRERRSPLAKLPYMDKVLGTVRAGVNVHKAFLLLVQRQFAEAVEAGGEISRDLATRIAAAKVEAPEFAIKSVSVLRRDVGSFGLMAESPFGAANDILLCCRFAEGDSRVLQQMLVRDLVKAHSSFGQLLRLACRVIQAWLSGALHSGERLSYLRDQQLLKLLWVLRRHARERRGAVKKAHAQTDAWLAAGDLVYDVAKAHAQHIIHSTVEHHFGRSRDTELFLSMSATDCKLCHTY